ncbi:unnamed protein product [Oikopleura dioica]|uniref:Uncharacterized protein n=1 Tax=Oikopleura dioica TaxID=34765 RepID=E4Y2A8_OIKDI|nr:unnamed protein product [Oikopleura dioica]
MSQEDVHIGVKKSILKLVCSELEQHPSKAGVVRFAAPKTKLEPYPDYDERESQAALDIAESAGTTIAEGRQHDIENDEVEVENGEGAESEDDAFSEYSDDGDAPSSDRFSDEEEEGSFSATDEFSDNAQDGFDSSDTYYSESDEDDGHSQASQEASEDEVVIDKNNNNNEKVNPKEAQNARNGRSLRSASIRSKREKETSVKQQSKTDLKSGTDRGAYKRSKQSRIAGERGVYTRTRLGKFREKPSKTKRQIESEEKGVLLSDRIKILRGRPRKARSPNRFSKCKSSISKQVAGGDNSKSEKPRSRSPEKCRKPSTDVGASSTNRKRRPNISNDSGRIAKQSRRIVGTSRASTKSDVKQCVNKDDSGKREPAVGKILRGINKPDKPVAAADDGRRVSGGRKSAVRGGADEDDAWAPGKPFPDCDTIGLYE